MAELLEIIMILSFGASWPVNVVKSYKSRTTKGKSFLFLSLIFFGYIAGIASKLVNEAYMASFASKWYVLFFYVLNFIMVGTDMILYFRNRALDKKREKENLENENN
jgi:alkyl hydroperoxide reductase subunit AhpC